MWGEAFAVLTALTWAASTVISAEALKKVNPVRSNALKTFFSTVLMIPIAFLAGEMNNLSGVSLQGLVFVTAAALIGIGIGDTLLYRSITLVGVSRAYTFAYIHPLFTMAIAVIFLEEPFKLETLIGTILIILSVVLILSAKDEDHGKDSLKGLLLALGTAFTWAIGIILVALGLKTISALLANALRYPVLSLSLFLASNPREEWKFERRDLMLLASSGIIGMVLGGITFLYSVNLIGASRATPLGASSPVWASVMSSFLLKEKVTLRLLLSSAIVAIGIYFITL